MTEPMRIVSLEPTVFFAPGGERNALRQLVHLSVQNDGSTQEGALLVRAGGREQRWPLGTIATGMSRHELFVPDVREPGTVDAVLLASGRPQDEQRFDWQPQKHWEVHIIHYSHHDLGYTDLPLNVLNEHADFMDDVLRYCEETEDWPPDARFRWMCEQAYSVVQFAETRPPEAMARLAHFIKTGQVDVTALYANETMELCGHEELVRMLYPAFELGRKYGFDIVAAEHNDIPGFSWGLASVLAGAGVKYFCPGIPVWYFGRGADAVHPCWDEARVLRFDTPGAFWWEGPDGARVLLWYDFHGAEWYPTSYRHALRQLPDMLRELDERGYPYDAVSYTIRGGHRDNSQPAMRSAYLAREWNERWAYPRLVTSTHRRFLELFERKWGATLKTLRGDLPGTDYSAAASCTPRETATNRGAHDALLTGEKLAAVASVVAGYVYPKAALDAAYRSTILYDEHCWSMYDPGGPAQEGDYSEKSTFAYRAAALAHDVTIKAANRICDQIAYPQAADYITVFNSLSWPRTDIVRLPLHPWSPCGFPMHAVQPEHEDEGVTYSAGGAIGRGLIAPDDSLVDRPFDLVDATTGKSVPFQVNHLDDPQAAQPWAAESVAYGKFDPRGSREIVFLAEDLPSLGYKTYRVVPRDDWPQAVDAGPLAGDVLENRFYRLQLDRETGTIASLLDKETGRELIDQDAAHGFGQIVVRSCETGEEAASRITGVSCSQDGPLYARLVVKGEALGCPRWTREITLYHGIKRIDANTRVLRDSTPMLEVYFAFPFRAKNPRFKFEAVDSVIEPGRDQLPGSNTDYYAVQHWASLTGDDGEVVWTPVDAAMAEFGGLWPGYVSGAHHGVTPPGYGHPFLEPGEVTRGSIYSLAMYNNFRTNFISTHPGESLFRYALTSAGGPQPGRARAFGWGVANPPVAVWMKGPRQGPLAAGASFCQVEPPNAMLLTLKQAEDGRGLIARLIETEGEAADAKVTLPFLEILAAYRANVVEENQHLLPAAAHSVEVPLTPHAVVTIRLVSR